MANPRIGMKSVLRGLELFLIGVALGTVGYYAYNHFSPTLELLTSEKPTSQGKVLYYRDPSGAPYCFSLMRSPQPLQKRTIPASEQW